MRRMCALFIVLSGAVSCTSVDPELREAERRELTAVYQSCIVCHSLVEAARGPYLDGMDAWYLTAQLKKFKAGIRGQNPENRSEHLMGVNQGAKVEGHLMEPLARYFEQLPVRKHLKVVQGDAENGAAVYEQHCASCHGKEGEGRKFFKAPRLHHLEDWYQLDQLRKFKNGKRAYHEKDVPGQVMAAAVKPLTDEQLKDVTHYIANELAEN